MNKMEHEQNWGDSGDREFSRPKIVPIINEHNRDVYKVVGWMLGSVSVLSLLGIIGLAYVGKDIPQGLIALGSVGVGGLSSLFSQRQ